MTCTRFSRPDFFHALIGLRVALPDGGVLHALGAHWCPDSPDVRLTEAANLLKLVRDDEPTLVAGDLNSPDPHGDHTAAMAAMRPEDRARYCAPDGSATADTRALRRLESAGLVDVGRLHGSTGHTLPTALPVPTARLLLRDSPVGGHYHGLPRPQERGDRPDLRPLPHRGGPGRHPARSDHGRAVMTGAPEPSRLESRKVRRLLLCCLVLPPVASVVASAIGALDLTASLTIMVGADLTLLTILVEITLQGRAAQRAEVKAIRSAPARSTCWSTARSERCPCSRNSARRGARDRSGSSSPTRPPRSATTSGTTASRRACARSRTASRRTARRASGSRSSATRRPLPCGGGSWARRSWRSAGTPTTTADSPTPGAGRCPVRPTRSSVPPCTAPRAGI